ncbi:MAG: non-heme iron oxygenase ferredoxin subunit [Burkholderiales bacterium]
MSNDHWVDVTSVDDVPLDDVIGLVVHGHDIAFYNVAGTLCATNNVCTHGQARLSEGFLLGDEIECPLHQGRFNVKTGAPTCEPVTEAIKTYPVKIEAGRMFVALD